MTRHVIADPAVARWVAKHANLEGIKTAEDFGPHVAFGVSLDRKPVAGIVYHMFRRLSRGNTVMVSICATDPRWCSRSVLKKLFSYPFNELGCTSMTAMIAEGNSRSIRLCKGLGFTKVGVMKRGWDGKTNALLFEIIPEQCKWIK